MRTRLNYTVPRKGKSYRKIKEHRLYVYILDPRRVRSGTNRVFETAEVERKADAKL
jgi:hypothetical protein